MNYNKINSYSKIFFKVLGFLMICLAISNIGINIHTFGLILGCFLMRDTFTIKVSKSE